MNGRFITEELVRDLIATGDICGNRPGKGGWVFEKQYDGVQFKLICDIGADLEPRIVTGVSEIVDRDEALGSDRWNESTVHQVELRTALSRDAHEVAPERMLELESLTPIDVKGHRVITDDAWDYVECVDCGMRTRSKADLSSTACN
ncbi:hypothetical protein HUG10_20725 (plasmid) [Halorarum halophilum]|uniref:Uncharacterized protein n=1 Tax=Halorarum halophilum TaxID=2743090 RepID=A0A7D5H410_9EURY|nr:hypothetical protein [Halobaculum halophilum]QLG30033.1 hypothetical protein HUG10_20725 [Halobaculum halophilum]